MRNTDDLQPKKPAEFSPAYVLFVAKAHLEMCKRRHTAAMLEASVMADEIPRCEQYLAELEEKKP